MAARKSSPLRASVGCAADFAALTVAAAPSCKALAAYEGTTPRWSSCARLLVAEAHQDAAARHASAGWIEADAGGEVSGGGRGRSACGGGGGDCSDPRDVLRSTSACSTMESGRRKASASAGRGGGTEADGGSSPETSGRSTCSTGVCHVFRFFFRSPPSGDGGLANAAAGSAASAASTE